MNRFLSLSYDISYSFFQKVLLIEINVFMKNSKKGIQKRKKNDIIKNEKIDKRVNGKEVFILICTFGKGRVKNGKYCIIR